MLAILDVDGQVGSQQHVSPQHISSSQNVLSGPKHLMINSSAPDANGDTAMVT